jgi:hypothetical protein
MDIETSAAIHGLGKRIDRVEPRIDALDVSIKAEFSLVRSEMAQMGSDLRAGLAETRRHAEILHEALRDDMRMLAEGFAMISVRRDAMQREGFP